MRPLRFEGRGKTASVGFALVQGVVAHPRGCFLVPCLDVFLELGALDAPLTAPTDLDRGQFAAADHVVDLRVRDVELGRYVGQQQESRLHSLSLPPFASGGGSRIATMGRRLVEWT